MKDFEYRGYKVRWMECSDYYKIDGSELVLGSIKAVHNVIDTYIKRTTNVNIK